jgi:hypothetical protein
LGTMADATTPPHCPTCQEPMRLGHVIPRFAGHPEIRSFQCSACGEVLTMVENDGIPSPKAR